MPINTSTNGTEEKKVRRHFARIFLLVAVASLGAALGLGAARADFKNAANSPPPASIAPPIYAGPNKDQVKAGEISVFNLFFSSSGRWASAEPKVRIKTQTQFAGRLAAAFCDPGYILVGCSGARDQFVRDTCAEEFCSYVGVVPIDASGAWSVDFPTGCRAGVSSVGSGPTRTADAVVHAYCLRP